MNDMLVSVVVVTYNSSEFIIEALDSVKNQTYQNIELIISDDCSQDNTVSLCKEWVEKNSVRFKNCELLLHERNTGNTANYNRGWKRAKGEWIKNLDGDDRLLPNCISDCVDYIVTHPNIDMLFAKMYSFNAEGLYKYEPMRNLGGELYDKLSRNEFEIATYLYNTIPSPTVFMRRATFLNLGGYDETFFFIEDWPMWMKMVKERCDIHFLDRMTVDYRLSNYSISQDNSNRAQEYKKCFISVQKKSQEYLRNSNLLSRFYYFSKGLKTKGSTLGKLIFALNMMNPYYYRQKNAWKMYYSISKE